MSKKKVFWGVGLILSALYILLSELEVIPLIPFFDVVWVLVGGYFIITGIMERGFFRIFLAAGLLFCKFGKYIPYEGVKNLIPIPVMVSALLLAIGCSMLFKKKPTVYVRNGFCDGGHGTSNVENVADGALVRVHNTFGAVSKYINSTDFRKGEFDNSFGSCNVYFNNAILVSGRAEVDVSNSFGEMNLYFPKTWRIEEHRDCNFGNVTMHGAGSTLPEAPVVVLKADSNFGQINIYFE